MSRIFNNLFSFIFDKLYESVHNVTFIAIYSTMYDTNFIQQIQPPGGNREFRVALARLKWGSEDRNDIHQESQFATGSLGTVPLVPYVYILLINGGVVPRCTLLSTLPVLHVWKDYLFQYYQFVCFWIMQLHIAIWLYGSLGIRYGCLWKEHLKCDNLAKTLQRLDHSLKGQSKNTELADFPLYIFEIPL